MARNLLESKTIRLKDTGKLKKRIEDGRPPNQAPEAETQKEEKEEG